jgi:Mor family transcriptional regulator
MKELIGGILMKIKAKDICDKLDLLFEIVGEEKFLEITKMYGGNNVYIPTYKSTIRNSRNREIVKRYNGVNANQLAAEYGICVNHVKRIINDYDL